MAPIKEECERDGGGEVGWGQLKVVVARLVAAHGVKDNRLQWSDPERDQARRAGPSGTAADGSKEDRDPNLLGMLMSGTAKPGSPGPSSSPAGLKRSTAAAGPPDGAADKSKIIKKMKNNSLFK